jgi:predicted AAA+ superfamily ATPase
VYTIKTRNIENSILTDLADEKMVFIGGPRQVGKTTLATSLITTTINPYTYLNWDNREDRKRISASLWPVESKLLIR